jgi:hypothetical protein
MSSLPNIDAHHLRNINEAVFIHIYILVITSLRAIGCKQLDKAGISIIILASSFARQASTRWPKLLPQHTPVFTVPDPYLPIPV